MAGVSDERNESYLHEEIFEQPQVLARLIDKEWESIESLARGINTRGFQNIVIAARGSSGNAATYGKYLFAALNRFSVALATPSLYSIYEKPPSLNGALVLGISQSGKSPDIVEVMAEARRQRVPTLAITNVPGSPLAETAEYVISCYAGEERSVAATKTYTAQLTALALLSVALADDEARLAAIKALPSAVERTLNLAETAQRSAERYRDMDKCVVIGRGYNYATAFEIALKLKELTYILVEPYSSADFAHGPIAIVEKGFPVILVAPGGQVYNDVYQLGERLSERDAELIVISDREGALGLAKTPLRLPVSTEEWLSPIVCTVSGQLFAYYLTLAKGYDPDHPRGLHKVTVTR